MCARPGRLTLVALWTGHGNFTGGSSCVPAAGRRRDRISARRGGAGPARRRMAAALDVRPLPDRSPDVFVRM